MVVTYHDRQLSILWPMHQPRQCHRKCCFSFFFFLWLPTPFIGGVICKICQWVENQTIIIHLLTNKQDIVISKICPPLKSYSNFTGI